jgi:hypothetical protein
LAVGQLVRPPLSSVAVARAKVLDAAQAVVARRRMHAITVIFILVGVRAVFFLIFSSVAVWSGFDVGQFFSGELMTA